MPGKHSSTRPSSTNEPTLTRLDLSLIWCWLTTAFRVSPLASVNARKGGVFSIFFARATRWWCGGWIASGRNYQDVTDTVREFIRRGIRIETVINRMVFDGTTTDPMQQAIRDSLIAFMAATAQAQAEVTKEAQKAGIAHARANDDGTKYRGRKPTFTCEQFVRVRELLNQGIGISAIAKTVGVKRQSVYRIRSEPEKQMAALRAWYPEDFRSKRSNPCCSTTSSAS